MSGIALRPGNRPRGKTMAQRKITRLWVIVACGLALLPADAWSQQKSLKDRLIGTWNLVSVSEDYGGGKIEKSPFGPNVKGAFNFSPGGEVMFMMIGADLPTPAAKPQESSRQVVAWFGKYSVDDAANTVTYTAEKATIPVSGDEFSQKSAPVSGPTGTFTPTLVFKRAN